MPHLKLSLQLFSQSQSGSVQHTTLMYQYFQPLNYPRTILTIKEKNWSKSIKIIAAILITTKTIPADVKVSLLEGQVTLDTSCRTSLKYLAGLNFILFFIFFGRSGRHRTRNLRFWRPALYQLSYTPSY